MSGEAGGLIIVPLALMAAPVVLGVLAVGALAAGASAAGSAAIRYEKEQRRKREQIRRSAAAQEIGSFRQVMQDSMQEQTRLNAQTSEQMMQQLQRQRAEMERVAAQHDPQAYQQYISSLKQAHADTMQQIAGAQSTFNTQYRQKIAESMNDVSQRINQQYATYMDQLQQLQDQMAERQQRAQELAKSYLDEAQTLLTSLVEDYEGDRYVPRQAQTLRGQYNQAVEQYNAGQYEGAIASAKDVALGVMEEIFQADALKQEWENYHKLAIVLSEEVKSFIEAQAVITPEVKQQAEQAFGRQLEEEIIGVRVADYSDKNAKGQTRYDYLMKKVDEVYDLLHGPQAAQLSTEQLKTYADFLNNELYPAITACINKAVVNMNNAFSRQNISEQIIDFFEEHNFTFNGYAYDDDCHDKALHIGLENQATGEELIITLAPELVGSGDVQTHVELKQIKGDEANEERKAYYRQCVTDVVKGDNPYAQVNISCNVATRNKLSTDTETRKKLKL